MYLSNMSAVTVIVNGQQGRSDTVDLTVSELL